MLRENDLIFMFLTSRKYNQKKSPDSELIRNRLNYFYLNKLPIKFIGYWGCSDKSKITESDILTCNFLNNYFSRIKHEYEPGIQIKFLFTSEHGVMNGYSVKNISSYKNEIECLFSSFGFELIDIQSIWDHYGLNQTSFFNTISSLPSDWWLNISNNANLEKSASKRPGYIKLGVKLAELYYIMREKEARVIESMYSDHIFFSFTSSLPFELLPRLPVLFLYTRKGWSNLPWYN